MRHDDFSVGVPVDHNGAVLLRHAKCVAINYSPMDVLDAVPGKRRMRVGIEDIVEAAAKLSCAERSLQLQMAHSFCRFAIDLQNFVFFTLSNEIGRASTRLNS